MDEPSGVRAQCHEGPDLNILSFYVSRHLWKHTSESC